MTERAFCPLCGFLGRDFRLHRQKKMDTYHLCCSCVSELYLGTEPGSSGRAASGLNLMSHLSNPLGSIYLLTIQALSWVTLALLMHEGRDQLRSYSCVGAQTSRQPGQAFGRVLRLVGGGMPGASNRIGLGDGLLSFVVATWPILHLFPDDGEGTQPYLQSTHHWSLCHRDSSVC